jgi:hypothetical protein
MSQDWTVSSGHTATADGDDKTTSKGVTAAAEQESDQTSVVADSIGPCGMPTRTITDGVVLDDTVLPEGYPVIDGDKLEAYPHQDDVVAIRHDYTRRRATGLWGEFEPLLLDHFTTFNAEHFFGKLPRLEIKLGRCASPRSVLGEYCYRGDHGMLGEIIVNHRLFHNGVKGVIFEDATRPGFIRYIDDVLLHEMVHAYCHLVLHKPEISYRGHGPVFASECNRIGSRLNLDPVKHAKSRKAIEAHLQRCNYWPWCVRDPSYYLGAVVDVEEASKNTTDDELASLLEGDEIGLDEMMRRLLNLAEHTKNTRRGREALGNALVASLRLLTSKPDLLPQFPAHLLPPEPVLTTEVA